MLRIPGVEPKVLLLITFICIAETSSCRTRRWFACGGGEVVVQPDRTAKPEGRYINFLEETKFFKNLFSLEVRKNGIKRSVPFV